MLTPILASWYVLGLCEEKTIVNACHIKVCILSGDLHIFVCMYIGEKFFSSKRGSFGVSRLEETNFKVHENFVGFLTLHC